MKFAVFGITFGSSGKGAIECGRYQSSLLMPSACVIFNIVKTSYMKHRFHPAKAISFSLIIVAILVVVLEGGLRLLCVASDEVNAALTGRRSGPALSIEDPTLGHRPNPAFEEHDAWGFRNTGVPTRSGIVAIGDSQTYGAGVEPDHAWPMQLSVLARRDVYSMAFGGYGPAHYVELWNEALRLQPRTVIVAVYTGNDLYDSFDQVTCRTTSSELEMALLPYADRIERVEQQAPLARTIGALFKGSDASGGIRAHVRSLRLFGLVRAVKNRMTDDSNWQAIADRARRQPKRFQVIDTRDCKTVLTIPYRSTALDVSDPRIEAGLHVSIAALGQLQKRADQSDIRLMVGLIPTKEFVIGNLLQDQGESVPEDLNQLMADEQDVRAAILQATSAHGFEIFDLLPALLQSFEAGLQPYPQDWDGHPNAAGHAAIARRTFEALYAPTGSLAIHVDTYDQH